MRRLELRPVASRRLRAALLLVLFLALLSISQSSLSGWPLGAVATGLALVFIQAWRAARQLPPRMVLTFRPLAVQRVNSNATETTLRCRRLSVYPWLVVLHADVDDTKRLVVVLLPDSLPASSREQWRQILIWAKLMRRQIAYH